MIRSILQSYKIHNCDVMIREDVSVVSVRKATLIR